MGIYGDGTAGGNVYVDGVLANKLYDDGVEGWSARQPTLWVVDNSADELDSVNPDTGTASLVGSFANAENASGLTFHKGKLYMCTTETVPKLYTLNIDTGAETEIGNVGVQGPQGIASDGSTMWMVSASTDKCIH